MTARCTCSGSAAGVRLQVADSNAPDRPFANARPRALSGIVALTTSTIRTPRALATSRPVSRSAVLYDESGNSTDAYFVIPRGLTKTQPGTWTAGKRTSKPVVGATLRENLIRPRFAKPRLTKPRRNPMTRFPLRRAACDPGGVAERLKAADCKSADVCLRRFESYPLHQRSVAAGSKGSAIGPAAARARSVGGVRV